MCYYITSSDEKYFLKQPIHKDNHNSFLSIKKDEAKLYTDIFSASIDKDIANDIKPELNFVVKELT